jgi:acyl-coenzyme A thioesterase PaaI-like protein
LTPIDVDEFLGARGDGRYLIREELYGAFGGSFGGVLGAIALRSARVAAPGRVPISLDLNFLRGVPAGDATVAADVLTSGRSMTSVSVTISSGDRLCTAAIVKLADQAVLADVDIPGRAGDLPPAPPYSSGRGWGESAAAIPMVATLQPRTITGDPRGVGFAIRVPWDSVGGDAEAACFAADGSVGAPLAIGAAGRFAHPNPDIAMRFMPGASAGPEIVGFGRVERGGGGTVLVSVEVWSGTQQLAAAVSCALQLPIGR